MTMDILPRTNAEKRNSVEIWLKDADWQKMSDRAIAEHCGVSAPFVGKMRAELEAAGTVNVKSERVDRKGRKIDTANIGTKPKQPQVESEEQQPSGTQEDGATVSLSTSPETITQLPPITQEPAPIKTLNSTSGSGSPRHLYQAKLRIEGETKEDIDAIALLLQQTFDVIEESGDFRNRGGAGCRRYLTVRVTSYSSINISSN